MFIVGLTGGIGSGKSTVSDMFVELGIPVIDADVVGKQLVTPPSPVLDAIVTTFGQHILHDDGTLNRSALREIVFASPAQRTRLEAIMHPAILDEMKQQASKLRAPYCIFSIPLLLETGQHQHVDRVLVIDCEPDLQIKRVAQRSGLATQQIQAIIDAQLPRDTRLQHADEVVNNNGDLDSLRHQVLSLHQKYLAFAC